MGCARLEAGWFRACGSSFDSFSNLAFQIERTLPVFGIVRPRLFGVNLAAGAEAHGLSSQRQRRTPIAVSSGLTPSFGPGLLRTESSRSGGSEALRLGPTPLHSRAPNKPPADAYLWRMRYNCFVPVLVAVAWNFTVPSVVATWVMVAVTSA